MKSRTPSAQCALRILPLLYLAFGGCAPEQVADEEPDPVETTPLPGPPLSKTTWSSLFVEQDSPVVNALTVLFFNIETQEDGVVTGWIWHIWGELYIGGYEVPPNQVVEIEGTYTYDRHLIISGSLYGHTAQIDGIVTEDATGLDAVITIDTDAYRLVDSFIASDYVTVYPQ